MFFSLTFWLSVYHSNSKYSHVQKNKRALSPSPSWRQTQTNPARLSRSIIHSLQCLIQHVSAGPWDCQCCYCSLPLTSSSFSFSSSLLASALLSRSHLLSAGNRQRHDWSAEVVDATSCHCGSRLCRNQRCVFRVLAVFSSVQSHVRSLRAGGAGTDEKEGFNYHTYLDSNIASDLLEEEKKTRREIVHFWKMEQRVFPTATNCYN